MKAFWMGLLLAGIFHLGILFFFSWVMKKEKSLSQQPLTRSLTKLTLFPMVKNQGYHGQKTFSQGEDPSTRKSHTRKKQKKIKSQSQKKSKIGELVQDLSHAGPVETENFDVIKPHQNGEGAGEDKREGEGPIQDYLRQLGLKIQERVIYPQNSLENTEEGVVIVEVVILKDGSLKKFQLHQSSGFSELDKGALKIFEDFKDLNPLPNGLGTLQLQVLIPIHYSLKARTR